MCYVGYGMSYCGNVLVLTVEYQGCSLEQNIDNNNDDDDSNGEYKKICCRHVTRHESINKKA